MAEEKAEVQKQYARVQDAKKTQEQYVRAANDLTKDADYDHLEDLLYHHMKAGPLRKENLVYAQAFFQVSLPDAAVKKLLDRIIQNLKKGHYAKFDEHEGVSFALSSLPNHMSIKWDKVREALMKARQKATADGTG